MAIFPFLVGVASMGAIAVAPFFWPSEETKRLREMKRDPLTRLDGLERGQIATVRGRVQPLASPLIAPVSERETVCYELIAFCHSESGHIVELERAAVGYWVANASGRLLVLPGPFAWVSDVRYRGADLETTHEHREELAERFEEVLAGRQPFGAMLRSLEVDEEILVRGRIGTSRISVQGPGPHSGGYRDTHQEVLTLVEDPQVERLVSDDPWLVSSA